MADPFVGEIRLFAGNFEPAGWMFCDGRELQIVDHVPLFSLIGTTYGGDGQDTFHLPDLQGRAPVHRGTSAGSTYTTGETGGVEEVQLTVQQIPPHTHAFTASSGAGNITLPKGVLIATPSGLAPYIAEAPSVNLPPTTVVPVGGSQPHENRTAFAVISFIIADFGEEP
jgi:microcystin-dependent protein